MRRRLRRTYSAYLLSIHINIICVIRALRVMYDSTECLLTNHFIAITSRIRTVQYRSIIPYRIPLLPYNTHSTLLNLDVSYGNKGTHLPFGFHLPLTDAEKIVQVGRLLRIRTKFYTIMYVFETGVL
jgi:hypothetical protein